jgi:hypothetical protein
MAELRRARRAVTLIFFVYGGVLATWVSRIPLIKQDLDLNTAQLSVALLGSPIGLILATQLVSALVERWTSAAVTRWALVAACVAMALPAFAWNLGSLAGSLFLLGMSLGALDIAMSMTLAVIAPTPEIAIAGYGVLGLGVATIVPIAFTLAGNTDGVPPAWAISRVTTLGYAGLFSSPPVVGLVAQQIGLTAALAIPAVLLLLVAPLSRITALTSTRAGAQRLSRG